MLFLQEEKYMINIDNITPNIDTKYIFRWVLWDGSMIAPYLSLRLLPLQTHPPMKFVDEFFKRNDGRNNR